jgi:fructose-bisphosphate aldolase, class I
VRLDADAAGYILHVGSPAHVRDFEQYHQVRENAQRFGMPLIVWSCPRGGAAGLIFGRNIWPRAHGESRPFTAQLKDILAR